MSASSFSFRKDVVLDSVAIPSTTTFILDEEEIMGAGTGAIFDIARIGNVVTMNINAGNFNSNIIDSSGVMVFDLPDAFTTRNVPDGEFPFYVFFYTGMFRGISIMGNRAYRTRCSNYITIYR